MKKVLLLLFIAVCGVFIFLKIQVLGNPASSFNQTTRYQLGRSPFWRTVLGLHNYGDAQGWYLQPSPSAIIVDVVQASSLTLGDGVESQFIQEVKKYTGRKVQTFDLGSAKSGVLTDSDLQKIVNDYRTTILPTEPHLVIVYADDYQREGGELAKTIDEFGMVVSEKRLKEVVGDYSSAREQYLESTILHEFGHQLGLEHNNVSGCIMNPIVEKPQFLGAISGDFTATDFCDYEQRQLQNIKRNFQ